MATKTTEPRMAYVALRSQDLPDGTHAEPGDEIDIQLFAREDGVYHFPQERIQKWMDFGYVELRQVRGPLPQPKPKRA